MKRFSPLFLVIFLVAWPMLAESTWEGTTAVSRYGEFPESGNYGASNSFAVNTAVTVKNLDNGKETTVIIVDRLENPGLFLLVSRDAAQELGISLGEISRVSASISHPEGAISTFPDDLPFNPDPDVNPAASVTSYPDILESITPADTTVTVDLAETTEPADEAADIAETTEPADEVAESTEDTGDVGDAAETTEPADTAETIEVAEVDDSPPKINGVDTPSAPPEEQPPAEPADEPSPPAETEDPVAVSALTSAEDAVDEDPRLIVENPPDPPVDRDEAPVVLDLMPAPVLDQTEKFVLLAEPDAPEVSDLVDTRDPELEEALRISSLEEPTVVELDETLAAIVPPEPVFEETVVVEEDPVAEDILIVSELIEPAALAAAGYEIPLIADEPAVESPRGPEESDDALVVSALETAIAEEDEAITAVADTPEVREGEGPDEPELRISGLDEPEAPVLDEALSVAGHEPAAESARITLIDDPTEEEAEGIAGLGLDEPVFVAEEDRPAEAEDILIVSDLLSPSDPGDTGDALAMTDPDEPAIEEERPVVVNGFAPPVYDPDEIDIVLEPAEPRPPEGRIAGADLLETAEGEEPATDVDVASVGEPAITERGETRETVDGAEEPDEARIVDTESADVARPEVIEISKTETIPDTEETPTEVAIAPVEYTTLLSRESFYLQLAAFSEAKAAARLKDDLSRIYPVTVYLTETTERPVYKVLVGPLNQDESGALLYQFKVRGFPDAFVRAGTMN